ncbi:8-oxo-dGTP diphosphatase [Emericellopsis cladophorae]|uniref:8-oxo-dGTP diphosphatase n=1 Tax=Emericellopsis cladophorae TaxID=2686198 RepID=A0A9P9Y8B2_9HYPO|nr:8-oxo-dGTP diphosphatase [Emericellopsis cladophorae]KAI6784634.1 8-oxo-dGTP diphosphatase [Emericellopsis cladophorae]
MPPSAQKPRKPGVAVLITHPTLPDTVLLGLRKGSHGANSWGLPGGHVDPGETHATTAAREVLEETGLEIAVSDEEVAHTQDDFEKEGKYYDTYFLRGTVTDTAASPEVKEPNKCAEWRWFAWDELRQMRETSGPDEKLFRPMWQLVGLNPEIQSLLK